MAFPVRLDEASWVDSKGPTPGTVALRNYLLANSDHTRSMGIYNYRPVRGGSSPSVHGEGRALDLGIDAGHRAVGDQIADALRLRHTRIGVQRLIWWERIWSVDRTAAGWRRYTGTAKHQDHIHIELNRTAAAGLTTEDLVNALGGTMADTVTIPRGLADTIQLVLLNAGYTVGSSARDPQGKEIPDGDLGPATERALLGFNHELYSLRETKRLLEVQLADAQRNSGAIKLSDLSLDTRLGLTVDTLGEVLRLAARLAPS